VIFMEKPIRCPSCRNLVPSGYFMCPYCGTDLRLIIRLRMRLRLKMKDIIKRMRDVVMKPKSTMQEIVAVPDYLGPSLITLVLALFLSMRYVIISSSLGLIIGLYPFLVILFLNVLIAMSIWFIISAIINWIFRLFGGTQTFDQTAAAIGYSLVPIVFGVFLGTLTLIGNPMSGGIAIAILIPFVIWSVILCSIALYYASNLPLITCVLASILAFLILAFFFFVMS